MKKILFGIVILAGFVLLTPSHLALAANFNINIKDNLFTPFAPMIQPGDTVTWTNTGAMPHTVTADDGSFDSGNIAPGATYSQTFTAGSVINYYCKLHSTASTQGGKAMNAVILINSQAPAGGPSPAPAPAPVPGPTPLPVVSPSPAYWPVATSTPVTPIIMAPGTGLAMPGPMPKLPGVYNAYPSGSLINDNGTIYLIAGETKIPFTNFSAFKGLGYSLKNIIKGDTLSYAKPEIYTINSATQAHPWGSWLVYKKTIYYSHESGMIGVPSWEVFTANGGLNGSILPMNKADIAVLNSSSGVQTLTINDSRLYK